MPDTTDYDDDIAMTAREVKALGMRVESLEARMAGVEQDLAQFRSAIQRMAEYQGVAHLLKPQ